MCVSEQLTKIKTLKDQHCPSIIFFSVGATVIVRSNLVCPITYVVCNIFILFSFVIIIAEKMKETFAV